MSVLACGRSGCDNIMCERLIFGSRYICESCWHELGRLRDAWPTAMPQPDVKRRIDDFMKTEPGSSWMLDAEDIEREFRRLTGQE